MTLESELKHLDHLGKKGVIEYYIQEIMNPDQSKLIKEVYYKNGLKSLAETEQKYDCDYTQIKRLFKHGMVEQDGQ